MSASAWGESFGFGHLWECADQTWTWIVFEALHINLKCLCPAYTSMFLLKVLLPPRPLFVKWKSNLIQLHQNDWMHQQSCACAAFISTRLRSSLHLARRKRVEEFLLEAFRSRRIPSSNVVGLSSMNWSYTWFAGKKHELLPLLVPVLLLAQLPQWQSWAFWTGGHVCSEVMAIPSLSPRVDDGELRKHFEAYGAVQAVDRKATSCSYFLNDSFLHGQSCLVSQMWHWRLSKADSWVWRFYHVLPLDCWLAFRTPQWFWIKEPANRRWDMVRLQSTKQYWDGVCTR